MSNTLFPCLDPNSPAPLPPPSPIQPTCPSLFPSSSSHRPKVKPSRPRSEELSDEILEEFYQKYGVDGEKLEELYRNGGGKRIHELLGSPYSQGVTAWRILTERLEKEFVAMMMRKKREAGGWIDRHRPRALDDFICHREKALLLRQLVFQGGVHGHFIFVGPPGVGKKTMVWAFLREAFGPDTLKTKEESKEFQLKGEETAAIRVNVTFSAQHVEIDLSKCCGYEKHVITALVTECNPTDSRAIVLYHADELCPDIQQLIRWIMERHEKCHKFLFCCTNLYNLQSIRSICTVIQLLPPSNNEIFSFLEHIAEKEGIEIPQDVAQTIGNSSTYNLRQAVQLLESSALAKRNDEAAASTRKDD